MAAKLTCGCKVIDLATVNANYQNTVEYCPLHQAAPKMLEALMLVSRYPNIAKYIGGEVADAVASAIAKAEGKKAE